MSEINTSLTKNIKKTLLTDTNNEKWDNLQVTDKDYIMYSPRPVGYNTTAEHRFLMSNLLIGYNCESVLDIGSGRSDLYGLIVDVFGMPANYHAIDHNPVMTDIATRKWNLDAVQTGAYETAELPNAEWVIASGIFTQKRCETEDDDLQKVFNDIELLYNLSTKVVSFNLLNPINNTQHEGFLYVHPGLVLDMLIEKYQNVVVRNNYSKDVYTVLIYKF